MSIRNPTLTVEDSLLTPLPFFPYGKVPAVDTTR